MIQYQKRKEVKSGSMQLFVAGFLSLCFATFAQGAEEKNGEQPDISRSSIEVSHGVPEGNQPCLIGLSDETLLEIFSYLSPGELVNISEVNWAIHNMSYDDKLWEQHIILESQRTGGLYRCIFKELCQNPIVFQFYNNSNLTVNFAFGYKYISDGSVIENMSTMVTLHHTGLWILRKNNFPEDIRNSLQPSHCAYLPQGNPGLPLVRIAYKQELPVGSCLEILQEQDAFYTYFVFNKISSLR